MGMLEDLVRRAGPAAVRAIPGSSLLEQSFRSMHVLKLRAGVARAVADYRNNARIKATDAQVQFTAHRKGTVTSKIGSFKFESLRLTAQSLAGLMPCRSKGPSRNSATGSCHK